MVNNHKLNRLVEYIKQSQFEFETDEVKDNLKDVLAYYGILMDDLTDDEYTLLMIELLPLAEAFELNEVVYQLSQEDPLIADIKERKFSLKIEKIERLAANAHAAVTNDEFLENCGVV